MKGASKQPNKYGKIKYKLKEQNIVYKEGETPYDKRREEYKKQLIRENKNEGYVPMTDSELEEKVSKKYPPSKRVK